MAARISTTPRSIDGPAEDWLDMRDMVALTRISEATLKRLMDKGIFPKQQQVTAGIRMWHWSDYVYWTLRVQKFGFPTGVETEEKENSDAA